MCMNVLYKSITKILSKELKQNHEETDKITVKLQYTRSPCLYKYLSIQSFIKNYKFVAFFFLSWNSFKVNSYHIQTSWCKLGTYSMYYFKYYLTRNLPILSFIQRWCFWSLRHVRTSFKKIMQQETLEWHQHLLFIHSG